MAPALDHLRRQVKALRPELSIRNKALHVLGPGPEAHTPLGPEPHTPPAGQGDVWMQNRASLVAAYFNEDWDTCRILCDAYACHNTLLRIVAPMQRGIMWH